MLINRQTYLDKLYACWIGKNIGGTMGAPYEACTDVQDIKGFNSPKGEPIPNDDLDLQLVWLCAVEERGIKAITPSLLAEYWISYIPPHWNEYGIGKANLKLGLLPPYSGEFNNEQWKNSNGAWIRTEIWSSLLPGLPELATRYAYNDACVDHGAGEGTNAAVFVAALESSAFIETDIFKLIDTALTYIPDDCRVARSVRLAISQYKSGVPFREARETIVKDSEDLGWFQAPANVAFVILGLLYALGNDGRIDFRRAVIGAINCGDDTDCTGATTGALLGIMYGKCGIPDELADYIGDRIQSCAVDLSYLSLPKSCTELTQRVYELVPSCLKAYGIYAEYTDGEDEREEVPLTFKKNYLPAVTSISDERLADFDIPENGLSQNIEVVFAKGRVELEKANIAPGESVKLNFEFKNTSPQPKWIEVELILPDGWTADKRTTGTYVHEARFNKVGNVTITVTAGEQVMAINKITALISSEGHPTIGATRIVLFG